MSFGGITGEGMPPYSTDPSLSLSRHQDPDYIDSSDPPSPLSSDTIMSVDIPIPSSPPAEIKMEDLYEQQVARASAIPTYDRTLDDIVMEQDERDEPTDADDDTEADDDNMGTTASSQPTFTMNIFQPLSNDSTFHQTQDIVSRNAPRAPIFAAAESTVQSRGSFAYANRSSSFVAASKIESLRRNKAEQAILHVFDDDENTINLENMGYTSVPEACRGLIDHEDLGRRLFELNLSGNGSQFIDRFLYRIDRSKYSNSRNNNISESTPLIRNLVALEEIHLGHNKLRTLPAELLQLPQLRIVTTHPNEFIVAPDDPKCRTQLIRHCDQPSLVELGQRSISQSGYYQEFPDFQRSLNSWVKEAPSSINPIIHSTRIGSVCSVCLHPVIKPVATYLHWTCHPSVRSSEHEPYQTVFCTDACLNSFLARVQA